MRLSGAAPLAGLLALAAPVHAQERPQTQPTRDVTVEYKLQDIDGATAPAHERVLKVYWAKNGALMRIEFPDEQSYVLLNRDTRRMTIVLLDQNGYVEMPYDPARPTGFTVPTDLGLGRVGSEVIAGYPCSIWQTKVGQGNRALCITDDGVLLRSQDNGAQHHDDLEATMVVYGPQPATVFAPPSGFKKLDMARRPG